MTRCKDRVLIDFVDRNAGTWVATCLLPATRYPRNRYYFNSWLRRYLLGYNMFSCTSLSRAASERNPSLVTPEISLHHHLAQLLQRCMGFPAQLGLDLLRVANE